MSESERWKEYQQHFHHPKYNPLTIKNMFNFGYTQLICV